MKGREKLLFFWLKIMIHNFWPRFYNVVLGMTFWSLFYIVILGMTFFFLQTICFFKLLFGLFLPFSIWTCISFLDLYFTFCTNCDQILDFFQVFIIHFLFFSIPIYFFQFLFGSLYPFSNFSCMFLNPNNFSQFEL